MVGSLRTFWVCQSSYHSPHNPNKEAERSYSGDRLFFFFPHGKSNLIVKILNRKWPAFFLCFKVFIGKVTQEVKRELAFEYRVQVYLIPDYGGLLCLFCDTSLQPWQERRCATERVLAQLLLPKCSGLRLLPRLRALPVPQHWDGEGLTESRGQSAPPWPERGVKTIDAIALALLRSFEGLAFS